MSPSRIVFISCGQSSPEERQLGADIVHLVDTLTPFTGYFAQNQASFDGVAENILGALARAVGFIGVLHPRGEVTSRGETSLRGSVWVEQELAIATYLRHVEGVRLFVRAFADRRIALEGIREKLILNPVPFTNNRDIIQDLQKILPTWKASANPYDLQDELYRQIEMACSRWRGALFGCLPELAEERDALSHHDFWDVGICNIGPIQIHEEQLPAITSVCDEGLVRLLSSLAAFGAEYGDKLPQSLRAMILRNSAATRQSGIALARLRIVTTLPQPLSEFVRMHLLVILSGLAEISRETKKLQLRSGQ